MTRLAEPTHSIESRAAFDRIVVRAFRDRHDPAIEDHWDTWQEAVEWAEHRIKAQLAEVRTAIAEAEHGDAP